MGGGNANLRLRSGGKSAIKMYGDLDASNGGQPNNVSQYWIEKVSLLRYHHFHASVVYVVTTTKLSAKNSANMRATAF